MYKITKYTKDRAKELGVEVKPSTVKGKKIDVFKDGKKVASVGAKGYPDYPTYIELEMLGVVGLGTAKKRQKAYKSRHAKNRKIKGSNGWYADKLLW